jgi:hypothetical protein
MAENKTTYLGWHNSRQAACVSPDGSKQCRVKLPAGLGYAHSFGRDTRYLCSQHHLEKMELDQMWIRMSDNLETLLSWCHDTITLSMGPNTYDYIVERLLERAGLGAEEILDQIIVKLLEADLWSFYDVTTFADTVAESVIKMEAS